MNYSAHHVKEILDKYEPKAIYNIQKLQIEIVMEQEEEEKKKKFAEVKSTNACIIKPNNEKKDIIIEDPISTNQQKRIFPYNLLPFF